MATTRTWRNYDCEVRSLNESLMAEHVGLLAGLKLLNFGATHLLADCDISTRLREMEPAI